MSERPDLSVIIVSWNCWDFLEPCIRSIEEHRDGLRVEVLVVDNASTDGTPERVRTIFPGARVIANGANVGFPEANNQAMAVAAGEFLLLLNPDTVVQPGTLRRSVEKLRADRKIGCLGVKTVKGDGSVLLHAARRRFTLWGIFWEMFFIDKLFRSWSFLGSSDMPHWDHLDSRAVDLLHGGYMMFPRAVYERLGGLDTKVRMYYEDVEYCARVQRSGLINFYLADVSIVHFTGKSSRKADPAWLANMRYDGMYWYFFEYGGGRIAAIGYVMMVLLTGPLRLLWSPIVALGYRLIKGERVLLRLLGNTWTSFVWSVRMMGRVLTGRHPELAPEARS